MKICFVTPRLPPHSVVGVETYVNTISGYLSKKHDVVVIAGDMDEECDYDYEVLRAVIIVNVDIFLSNTNCTREIHIKHGFPPEKIKTLNYHSPQVEHRDTKEMADENTRVILYVGGLMKYNGVQYLLEALSHLRGRPYTLWIVWIGNYQETLEDLTKKLELTDKVKFYGKLFGTESLELHNAADVVVIPSVALEAGTTLVAHEVISSGKLIIGSNIGGIHDAIDDGKTGIMGDLRDTITFAKKMDPVLSDKDFRILLDENAKKKNDEIFSLDRDADNLSEIYGDIKK